MTDDDIKTLILGFRSAVFAELAEIRGLIELLAGQEVVENLARRIGELETGWVATVRDLTRRIETLEGKTA